MKITWTVYADYNTLVLLYPIVSRYYVNYVFAAQRKVFGAEESKLDKALPDRQPAWV